MRLITDWLNGKRNFIIGRALYGRFGNDAHLKTLLAKGETPDAKNRLAAALQQLVKTVQVPVTVAAPALPVKADEVLASLDAQWKPLYKRMQMLRHDMIARWGTDNSEAARAACRDYCMEILDLEQQCMVIWAQRDHYMKHGALPDMPGEEDAIPTDPLQLARFIEKCARTIRRYRNTALTNPKHAAIRMQHKLLYEKAAGKPYTEKGAACAE